MKKLARFIYRWFPTWAICFCMMASIVNCILGEQLHELRWFASAMFWMLIEGWRRLGEFERRADAVLRVMWSAMHEDNRQQPTSAPVPK